MKIRITAIGTVFACLFAPVLTAETYAVKDSDSFQTAWGKLKPGDTLQLSGNVDLGSVSALPSVEGDIHISSESGKTYSLIWLNHSVNNSPLPGNVVFDRVTITGAPAGLLSGVDLVVGSGNRWSNNTGTLLKAASSVKVGENNIFENNVSGCEGGAVIAMQSGGRVEIAAGNVFSGNMSAGRGGVLSVADQDKPLSGQYNVTLNAGKADSSILFTGNTEEAVLDNGVVSDPGFANDIYFGKNTSALLQTGKGARIVLGSGISSADSTATLTKTGAGDVYVADASDYKGKLTVSEGSVTLLAGNIWGSGSKDVASAAVSVAKGATFIQQKGGTLASDLHLAGGRLTVLAPATLEGNLTLSTGASEIRFVLNRDLLTDAGRTPLLSLPASFTITAGSGESLLVTNLDVSGMTSLEGATIIEPYGDWSVLSDATRARLMESVLTYTDAAGTHLLPDTLLDPVTGSLDLGRLKDLLHLDRPGAAVANALWSSVQSLGVLRNAVGDRLSAISSPQASGRSVWVSGLVSLERMGNDGERSGYDYSGGGYALGVDWVAGKSWTLGLTLSQMIGTNDAKGDLYSDASAKVDQDSLMAGIYAQYKAEMTASDYWTVDSFLGYGFTDNELKNSGLSGSWDDTNFAVSLQVARTFVRDGNLILKPFVGLDFLTGSQDSFSAKGSSPLHYDGADMYVLSLPVGVTLARTFEAGPGCVTPSLTVAYVADLARECPDTRVMDAYGASWTAKGTEPGRSALRVRAALENRWTASWSGVLAYVLSARSHETTHTLSAGLRYEF